MLIHELCHEVIGGFRKSCKQHLQLCTLLPNYVLLTARTEKSMTKYFCQLLCSYILFSVHFRTDSSSVRKLILKILITFSEPIPVRFGIFGMDFFDNFSVRSGKIILTFEQKISNVISVQFGANTSM